VPVPFHHFIAAVDFFCKSSLCNFRRPRAESHACTLVVHAALFFQQRDDRLRGVLVEFGAVRISDFANISCEFDRRHLHTEAKTEVGELMLACVTRCFDFSFDTTLAKAAWN